MKPLIYFLLIACANSNILRNDMGASNSPPLNFDVQNNEGVEQRRLGQYNSNHNTRERQLKDRLNIDNQFIKRIKKMSETLKSRKLDIFTDKVSSKHAMQRKLSFKSRLMDNQVKPRCLEVQKSHKNSSKPALRKLFSDLKSKSLNASNLGDITLNNIHQKSSPLIKRHGVSSNADSQKKKLTNLVAQTLGFNSVPIKSYENSKISKFLKRDLYKASRKLQLPPVVIPTVIIPNEKVTVERLKAREVSGGSMMVKFPDSPPTIFVTQQPYYSY